MEKHSSFRPKPQAIGEAVFDIAYLLFDLAASVIFLLHAQGQTLFLLFALLAFILGAGDAFHLIPRVCYGLKGPGERMEHDLGLGLAVSSVTMTVFYLVLFAIWRNLYPQAPLSPAVTGIIWFSALLRIILCLFPQNNWFHHEGNPTWSLLRNAPFVVTGLAILLLFLRSSLLYHDNLWQMSAAILVSFACYLPVTLLAKKKPAVGALMLPKTLAYVWMISLGLSMLS